MLMKLTGGNSSDLLNSTSWVSTEMGGNIASITAEAAARDIVSYRAGKEDLLEASDIKNDFVVTVYTLLALCSTANIVINNNEITI